MITNMSGIISPEVSEIAPVIFRRYCQVFKFGFPFWPECKLLVSKYRVKGMCYSLVKIVKLNNICQSYRKQFHSLHIFASQAC